MIKYVYNAWGIHTVNGSLATTVGAVNPFRYRSYFYDVETGLYYLKTRYYDPEITMQKITHRPPYDLSLERLGHNIYYEFSVTKGYPRERAKHVDLNPAFTDNDLKTQVGKMKFLSPDAKGHKNNGGTLLKIGKELRFDVNLKSLFHMHLPKISKHIPLGTIVAGIIGGF